MLAHPGREYNGFCHKTAAVDKHLWICYGNRNRKDVIHVYFSKEALLQQWKNDETLYGAK